MAEAAVVKTQIANHVFHYATHSVVWQIHYNPTKQSGFKNQQYHIDAQDGGELFVWCNFYLTREAAEEAVKRTREESFAPYFDVSTHWHHPSLLPLLPTADQIRNLSAKEAVELVRVLNEARFGRYAGQR